MKIDGYTRISVDLDEDKKENTSIEHQKEIIADYVAKHFPDAELEFFVDRDRSGYTFEQREDYQRMRKGLLSGDASILIVKDFSRFSRRNSLGLLELETLRDAKVRIISIGDGIDYPTKDDWMLIQFKFLMNEFPVTDTSKKIKTIIQNRQEKGKWVCAVPYGYRITNTKEMTYEIDPPAAEIVREVFRLYNNGWGYKRIANHLTDLGVPTPRAAEIAHKMAMGQKTKLKSKDEWSIITVQKMLSNDFYVGVLRQGKYKRRGINGVDERVEENDHIIIENAHEPIVDTKTFAYAQEQLSQRTKSNYRGERKYNTDYSGFLFCGDCGAPMFSMSRPDLKPAYTCGTYHRRGLKGCTSHHIRVDKLDELLKRYVKRVAEHSATMIAELELAIQKQPDREEQIGHSIDRLQEQLSDAKAQFKALLKRKVVDTIGKSPEQAEIIAETYTELEEELTKRISYLESEIDSNIDVRNKLIQTNRKAKTVLDVFESILTKPNLDKRDIGLIVDRIVVCEDHIEIKLKADIDGLLEACSAGDYATFTQGSKDISNETIVQSAPKRPDKVFAVNVINSGDPLEIYTSRDGEVIFKKYSLLGGVEDFAVQLCETMSRSTGSICAVTDRDTVIAVAGGGKRELLGKHITAELEQIMENRHLYHHTGESQPVAVSDASPSFLTQVAAPILSEGDLLGLVLFIGSTPESSAGEAEVKLAQTIAAFLGRHMES